MSVLFSKDYHAKINGEVEESYHAFLEELNEELGQAKDEVPFSAEFMEGLAGILRDKGLKKFSPLNFYWINLIDNLIYLGQVHQDLAHSYDLASQGDELSPVEEELFSFWNDSDMAENFMELMNEGLNVEDASFKLMPLLEAQALSFFELHCADSPQADEGMVYKAVPELGDFEGRLYLGDAPQYVDITSLEDIFPIIPVEAIAEDRRSLALGQGRSVKELKVNNGKELKIDGHPFVLASNCAKGVSQTADLKKKARTALDCIKAASPEGYKVLTAFSRRIVPIDEPGVVSYSMQSLPGISCINMFERDLVDLMDDLLHENGHHFLNAHLNAEELLNEDDDKIYFSPWRNALRPVRGIYHAVFTFYWALHLFSDTSKALAQGKLAPVRAFGPEERAKVHRRAVEEFLMLQFTRPLVEHAHKHGKVTDKGMELVKGVYSLVDGHSAWILETLVELEASSPALYADLKRLESDLEAKRAHYRV